MRFTPVALSLALMFSSLTAYARPVEPLEVAAEVDRILAAAFAEQGVSPSEKCSDVDFLRRAAFDLTGGPPSADEAVLFAVTPDGAKRAELVERLLETEGYSLNWARYWKDVIFSHATNQRARLSEPRFERWMAEQFREGRKWDEIATELITATGDVRENGAVGLLFAHDGEANEIAGEVSRIFMGVQIQCAQCHDHPYDAWKREDFHKLAAFFPRVRVRPVLKENAPRSFEVVSQDRDRTNARARFARNPDFVFRFIDKNRDGRITESETEGTQLERPFPFIVRYGDKDGDGALNLEELKNLPEPPNDRNRSIEHFMPDLSDPDAKGELISPALFASRNVRVSPGTSDSIRRKAAAAGITSTRNPWFARAYVNRMWAELVGEGFYHPLDDMGPQREASYADALDALVFGFAASDYDPKWLFRAIMNTEAYQRALDGSYTDPVDGNAFAATGATRLRADQIYNALSEVLGQPTLRSRVSQSMGGRLGGLDRLRFAFNNTFGFDPSTPKEDLTGDIPQALFLMNSDQVNRSIAANPLSQLGRLLRRYSDDKDAIAEVYLNVLSREPTAAETKICLAYIDKADSRRDAYEDLVWSLINSAEFVSRR
ncbi:DUF1549 domain-containing protein [Stratiformator vulcanicus]|uniref:EF hand n=1 Tax=Stratiformator vulcanicus TaxID=2527980 RepID=A0A517QVS1_9PLAN|nr:DUF1549 domain-containing protein [Stratiformator vulcanicus]QDT35721.1 EF hand [Stratiformator vulcanicus]